MPCKWNFLFPSVTCIVYSVVALSVSLTLLCDDAKFKFKKTVSLDRDTIDGTAQAGWTVGRRLSQAEKQGRESAVN